METTIDDKVAELKLEHMAFIEYLKDNYGKEARTMEGHYRQTLNQFIKIYDVKNPETPLYKQAVNDTHGYLCNMQTLQRDARNLIIARYI